MTQFYANPYDISATGFYFENYDDYLEKSADHKNAYGDAVEEYEIDMIDGELIDIELFKALSPSQGTVKAFIEFVEEWSDDDKTRVIIACGECGYSFDFDSSTPDDFDVDIYYVDSLTELAEQFVDEGLYGEIPEMLTHYIDYEAIARDLGFDYSETTVNGEAIVYRCC